MNPNSWKDFFTNTSGNPACDIDPATCTVSKGSCDGPVTVFTAIVQTATSETVVLFTPGGDGIITIDTDLTENLWSYLCYSCID
jgi:hypothetical protein